MQKVDYSLVQNQREQQMFAQNQNAVQNQYFKSTQVKVGNSWANKFDKLNYILY